jgi:hypothetical protein
MNNSILTLKGKLAIDAPVESPKQRALTPSRAAYLARRAEPKPKAEFWFVWSPQELRPKNRHRSHESASVEAARLRAVAPHREFIVYHAVAVEGMT